MVPTTIFKQVSDFILTCLQFIYDYCFNLLSHCGCNNDEHNIRLSCSPKKVSFLYINFNFALIYELYICP